jgi:hypothetical protein
VNKRSSLNKNPEVTSLPNFKYIPPPFPLLATQESKVVAVESSSSTEKLPELEFNST